MLQKCHHFLFSAHLLKIDSKMNLCLIQSLKSLPYFLNLFLENCYIFSLTSLMAVELPLVEPVDLEIYKKLFLLMLTYLHSQTFTVWSTEPVTT